MDYIDDSFDYPNWYYPEGDYRITVAAYCEMFC
jgi:hypothetical protein